MIRGHVRGYPVSHGRIRGVGAHPYESRASQRGNYSQNEGGVSSLTLSSYSSLGMDSDESA